MQPHLLRLLRSGLTVTHDGYTVTACKASRTHDDAASIATQRLFCPARLAPPPLGWSHELELIEEVGDLTGKPTRTAGSTSSTGSVTSPADRF